MSNHFMNICLASVLSVAAVTATSCNWNPNSSSSDEERRQRDEKTRDDAAKATERLKPAIESAGRKLGEAADRAAEDARAAAQGIKEGWDRGQHAPLDLNSASETQLTELPGITGPVARKIIRNRPYRDKQELATKGILSHSGYAKIQDNIFVK